MNIFTWGIAKKDTTTGTLLEVGEDLVFVANKDKLGNMNIGEKYLLLYWRDNTGELIGTEKMDQHILDKIEEGEYTRKQKVKGYIYRETPLGLKVYFDNKYSGILYKNEIFGEYEFGKEIDVYIKTIRDDLKVDLSLRPVGYVDSSKETQQIILDKLNESGGELKLFDKSDPEEIRSQLGVSKKKFKEAIGTLYKSKKISISKEGIKNS